MLIHGTAVALADHGILIRGHSGAGKSDLALRLLALPHDGYPALAIPPIRNIALVSDDQVEIAVSGGNVLLSAPETIRGKIEVRGLGIVTVPQRNAVPLALVVDIVDRAQIERMPETATVVIAGNLVAAMPVAAFEVSAPLKILIALHHRIER